MRPQTVILPLSDKIPTNAYSIGYSDKSLALYYIYSVVHYSTSKPVYKHIFVEPQYPHREHVFYYDPIDGYL